MNTTYTFTIWLLSYQTIWSVATKLDKANRNDSHTHTYIHIDCNMPARCTKYPIIAQRVCTLGFSANSRGASACAHTACDRSTTFQLLIEGRGTVVLSLWFVVFSQQQQSRKLIRFIYPLKGHRRATLVLVHDSFMMFSCQPYSKHSANIEYKYIYFVGSRFFRVVLMLPIHRTPWQLPSGCCFFIFFFVIQFN